VGKNVRQQDKLKHLQNELSYQENHQVLAGPEQEEANHGLYKAIAELKETDRLIIGLLLEGCSYKEIANITGLSPSNTGVRINRIKKQLSKKLSKK